MKYLVKIFIFSILLLGVISLHAQVASVQYALLLNSKTNFIDGYLYINEGEANSVRERVQFNAQYSVLVPTGAEVSMASSHMPLTHNQTFTGEIPLKWVITSSILSPAIFPEYDFYGITPTLAPAGFYNKVKEGELIKLFSLKIEGENIDLSKVRLYDNDTDPSSNAEGMNNGDFSNGFTMGGYHQLFKGTRNINGAEANYTSLEHEK